MAFQRKKTTDEAPRRTKPPKSGRVSRKRGASGDAKKKTGRFVLIIGDDGAILVFMQGGVVVRRLFAPSPRPDHMASIVDLMQNNPRVPLSILADVIDQQYVRHNFPPVSSLSVNGLVKRRMERDFQAEDLKGFLRLGREKAGRKEWSYLLIALAHTPLMQQWLEFLVELPNELKGIYLVPLEAQNYIPALKKHIGGTALPWQLLITHNKVSGFRQVVLNNGQLVFTRVTQAIDDGVAAVIAGNIEQEIISTIEYLRRLGFQENNQLEIMVIAAQEVKETLDLNRFGAGAAHALTPLDVSDMLDLQQAALSADRFGDVVMSSWFAGSNKRVLRFFTAYGEKLAKLYMARRGLRVAVVLLVLALVALAGMNIKNMIIAASEAKQIDAQLAPQRAEMARLRQSLDALDKDVAFKTAVVTVYDAYLKDTQSPLGFVATLAPHVNENFRVKDITWAPAVALPGQSLPPGQAAEQEVKVIIDIQGQFADVESLTRKVDEYVANLKREMSQYEITVAPYSWLQGASSSMEISFDQTTVQAGMAEGNRQIDVIFRGPKPAAPNGAQPGPDPSMP